MARFDSWRAALLDPGWFPASSGRTRTVVGLGVRQLCTPFCGVEHVHPHRWACSLFWAAWRPGVTSWRCFCRGLTMFLRLGSGSSCSAPRSSGVVAAVLTSRVGTATCSSRYSPSTGRSAWRTQGSSPSRCTLAQPWAALNPNRVHHVPHPHHRRFQLRPHGSHP